MSSGVPGGGGSGWECRGLQAGPLKRSNKLASYFFIFIFSFSVVDSFIFNSFCNYFSFRSVFLYFLKNAFLSFLFLK